MDNTLLATVAVIGFALPARAGILGAMADCVNIYNQYRALGRAGGFRGDDLLKSMGSLCPDPSDGVGGKGPSDWFIAGNDGHLVPPASLP